MTDFENLFRAVAQRLLKKGHAAKGTHACSREEIEKELVDEARSRRCDLGEPGPRERGRRLQRIRSTSGS